MINLFMYNQEVQCAPITWCIQALKSICCCCLYAYICPITMVFASEFKMVFFCFLSLPRKGILRHFHKNLSRTQTNNIQDFHTQASRLSGCSVCVKCQLSKKYSKYTIHAIFVDSKLLTILEEYFALHCTQQSIK